MEYSMGPETLIGTAAAAIALVVVLALFNKKRQPPSRIFKCGRCGSAAHHNDRTSNAWRNGKTRFFCQACHRQWLQSQPPSERRSGDARSDFTSSTKNGGCLGVLALLAVLPLGGWLAWACI
ncbi:hypothetical protein [Stenotrophomonas indicatrix]|jgi:hypothetical protein|nr:hypothetical protein [Stenotrophomonas indicatrix]MDN8660575.1 hypothetical protein [Stenotrophomonas indicatrix]